MSFQAGSPPWYREGLRFKCTRCGNCCTGAPGYVFVSRDEIAGIARFLGRPDERLTSAEIRRVGSRYSLTERRNGDCVFLKSEGGRRICTIYPVRPLQCRTWPFWDTNLETPADWAEAARDCPGMNHGPRRDFVAIEQIRTARCWEDVPT